jgi:hypothetical protein
MTKLGFLLSALWFLMLKFSWADNNGEEERLIFRRHLEDYFVNVFGFKPHPWSVMYFQPKDSVLGIRF